MKNQKLILKIIAETQFSHGFPINAIVTITSYDPDDDSYKVDGEYYQGQWVTAGDLQPISKK